MSHEGLGRKNREDKRHTGRKYVCFLLSRLKCLVTLGPWQFQKEISKAKQFPWGSFDCGRVRQMPLYVVASRDDPILFGPWRSCRS